MKRIIAVVLATALVTGVAWAKKPKPADPAPAPTAAPAAAGDASLAPVVKYRHVLMESWGKHLGLSKMILDGGVSRPADLVAHADALAGTGKDLVALFPAGSGPDAFETEALATIWETPEEFAAAAAAYEQATAKFAEAARSGDVEAAKAAFGGVGQSCGGCHDSFRKDDH